MQKPGRIPAFQERREPYLNRYISTYQHKAPVERRAIEHKIPLQEPKRR